jgi:predicted DNA-binding ribbon-helix-helix protein
MAAATDEPSAAGSGEPVISNRPSRPVKKSFSIAGHRTSVSLEAAFWEALAVAAKDDGVSQASIVQRIDRARGDAGLSSSIRVWLLARAQARTGQRS